MKKWAVYNEFGDRLGQVWGATKADALKAAHAKYEDAAYVEEA